MCLETIEKRYPKKDKTEGFGYKVICIYPNSKRFTFPHFCSYTYRHYNKWIRRKISKLFTDNNGEEYDSGFHIFMNKQDAILYAYDNASRVRKVEYKGIICEGTQFVYCNGWNMPKPCLVVKQIKVLSTI